MDNNIAGYFEIRSGIYNLLSKVYRMESTADFLELLKRHLPVFEEMLKQYPESVEGRTLMKEGLDLLKTATAHPLTDALLEEHERMFASIFMGVIHEEGVTPHESVYLSPTRRIMQDERDQVLESYCNEKVGVSATFKEPEDHLCAELNFMAILSKQTADAINEEDFDLAASKTQAQIDFLRDHLNRWVHLAAADIAKIALEMQPLTEYDTGKYFAGIAKLTAGFTYMDLNVLQADEMAEA